jgi:glyoxylase-like metal-dependent hydrolase (beta-lactamase superfamily II)
MRNRWKIGQVTITRVVEIEAPFPGTFVLPDAVPENVTKIGWLQPHFANAEGALLMSVHPLVVESEGRRILVDTCIGNDKERPSVPNWHLRQGSFLRDLAAAGFPRESIDTVLCTHLHVDHVGWNTMKVDGRWVPTFPSARYLVAKNEWQHWKDVKDEFGDVIGDSVRPVFDAGLADLVDPDHRLTGEVRLESTPGHTPGHVSVVISSAGHEAVITGDLMHHPCQMTKPLWASNFDYDQDAARATRRRFLEKYAGTSVLVLGTHFATPTAGKIVRHGDAYRFET